MRTLLFILMFCALAACGQNYNSSSNDNGGDIGIDCTALPRLCAAYTAMKSNHCFECHSWSSYRTDSDWVNAGLVVKNNPTSSHLVQKLKNAGGDMPENFGPMANDEYDAVKDWILNM